MDDDAETPNGIGCECRYCGTFFTAAERCDDCGGCRLDDEQCADYSARRFARDGGAE